MVDRSTFFAIQNSYCVDSITEFWNEKISAIIAQLRSKGPVVLGESQSDGRMDSPGFCAQYCTYTAMDNDKEYKGIYKDIGVVHCLDIWHGQQKSCSILLQWDRDICNHFWYCCKIAGTYLEFFDMWVGLLHHVTGEHEWALCACRHGPLVDSREKDWIVKNSPAQQKLREIILDIRWLKNVHLYLPFRSTAELESFHNHILMYASKRHSFSPQRHKAWTLLAGLDYNHHLDRPTKRRQDRSIQFGKTYNKRLRTWRLCIIKVDKDFSYIPELQSTILHPDPQDQKIHAGWESYLVSLPQVLRNSYRSKSAKA
ncbi:hypothetical protein N1851_021867 [Merluccius polli]|uniref:Uncharacterized protein n=1 Tax=Merluccius polli TaxID=89951 RepID=A0AA47NZ26_MERPO|nr:hypothetical protein N1851_021867 [Merluccius polli]